MGSRDHLTIATLNTRGIPVFRSRLSERYAEIGRAFEASAVDVVNLQEVLTYYHLRQLRRHMPSYRSVRFRPSAPGPAGGLVILSRGPVAVSRYQRFPVPPAIAAEGVPRLSRLKATLKGILLIRLASSPITVVNTHLLANPDGDWSETNRFYRLHQDQLAALGRFVASVPQPAIVCGDFNISSASPLYDGFIHDTGLVDAFGGDCPPTFHREYLGPGKTSHCIDFMLLSGRSIKADSAELTFTDRVSLPGGPAYVSDHKGLTARVEV